MGKKFTGIEYGSACRSTICTGTSYHGMGGLTRRKSDVMRALTNAIFYPPTIPPGAAGIPEKNA
jgi:hypothetical protein